MGNERDFSVVPYQILLSLAESCLSQQYFMCNIFQRDLFFPYSNIPLSKWNFRLFYLTTTGQCTLRWSFLLPQRQRRDVWRVLCGPGHVPFDVKPPLRHQSGLITQSLQGCTRGGVAVRVTAFFALTNIVIHKCHRYP